MFHGRVQAGRLKSFEPCDVKVALTAGVKTEDFLFAIAATAPVASCRAMLEVPALFQGMLVFCVAPSFAEFRLAQN